MYNVHKYVSVKEVSKYHVIEIASILMPFFLVSLLLLCLFFSLFLPLNLDFTIFTFWYSIKYFGNKLESSTIGQIEKTMFTTEFLTVANTLLLLHSMG